MSIKQVAVTFALSLIGLTSFSTHLQTPTSVALPTTDRPSKTVGGGTRYAATPVQTGLAKTDDHRRNGGGTKHQEKHPSGMITGALFNPLS